ncbi:MAG: glycogen synthase GlgA [Victivallales bacterium]|nr:glycogen synthase GlgA [Victivallales bacterium]
MNICWICSEAAPYAKSGGLADVSAALPAALAEKGHKVSVFLPYYPQIMGDFCASAPVCFKLLEVPFGWISEWASIRRHRVSDNLSYYFIEFQRYFDRPFLYDYYGVEFGDNAERFTFLSRAAMQAIVALKLEPDILHTNDWHTSLCNVYLKSHLYAKSPNFAGTRSVLTIHNIGYQGIFPKGNLFNTGLGWEFFNYTCLEYFDQINFLKAGIMTADSVTTVSPSYAREILTPGYGFSMENALQHVHFEGRLTGILNGICTSEWSPSTDKFIPHNYSAADISGKSMCKAALQKELGLSNKPRIPLVGCVSRFAYQKGIDVLAEAVEKLLIHDNIQFAVLGAGESYLEAIFSDFCRRFPGKIGVFVGYNNLLAHLITAGSDLFAMPSRYEPCGLSQMYSMQYGTVPVVRLTGGLEDTVFNYNPEILGKSTGFTFRDLYPQSLANTIRWAAGIYKFKPAHFKKMMLNGMGQDFSWRHTADIYEQLYKKNIERR